MQSVYAAFLATGLAVVAYFGHQVWSVNKAPTMAEQVKRELIPNEEFVKHSDIFNKKEVIKVTDNIYVAIGFALGNSIMVIAPEGLIIVDVTESVTAAREILKEFRKITNKPIKAILYTHHHQDHIGGAQGFLEKGVALPEVWSHHKLPNEVASFFTTSYGAKVRRSSRQFGVMVPASRKINAGLGLNLRYDSHGFIPPTKLATGKDTFAKIAGLDVHIHHIPGETSDQIGVWIPSWKAFLSGDDVYKAFPNIYTIRGAPARDPVDWYTSVQKMLDLDPDYLVPSHHRPLIGKNDIRNVLIPYRDGIQFVHDQALRFINKGLTPDEIAKRVKLPEKLEKHPYLREFYGTVPWSVKGVFQLYLGWFSGDPVDLFPLSTPEKGSRVIALVGGVDNVISEAIKAWNKDDIQWALELASYVLIQDKDNKDAKKLKVDALNLLGSRQINSIAANYYITCALETEGIVNLEDESNRKNEWQIIQKLPLKQLFQIFSTMFTPEVGVCETTEGVVQFIFSDTNNFVVLIIRNGVAIIEEDGRAKNADVTVKTTEPKLKAAFITRLDRKGDFTKDLDIDGSITKFKNYMNCFEEDFQLLLP
ncbi:linear primary-alkylsulfatase-like [Mytilus californianus]|uniref:linear primary-alkylsulfatase-like n=1 Tax=Mytilus californianus TaxID=6549 RepID=UPI002245D9AA|nr:linear primary-alkylsulfatase-like [Mytilus californianus]